VPLNSFDLSARQLLFGAAAADLLDVISVDLDGGCITVPENMTVHQVSNCHSFF